MKISVIIPTYKSPKLLDLCLQSAIEGQILNNQIIVVVDGFYDLNKDVLEKDEAFAAGIRQARARGFNEKEALMQQAADEEKKIIADINSKAQAELAEIRDRVTKEASVARESLQTEVDNFANQICQKILGRAV